MRRREDIRKFWFFDCKCKRCADPTELNSYMSAVTCFACKRGFLLPISALEYKSDWQCDHCRNVVPYDLVNEVISTIEAQVFHTVFLTRFWLWWLELHSHLLESIRSFFSLASYICFFLSTKSKATTITWPFPIDFLHWVRKNKKNRFQSNYYWSNRNQMVPMLHNPHFQSSQ